MNSDLVLGYLTHRTSLLEVTPQAVLVKDVAAVKNGRVLIFASVYIIDALVATHNAHTRSADVRSAFRHVQYLVLGIEVLVKGVMYVELLYHFSHYFNLHVE